MIVTRVLLQRTPASSRRAELLYLGYTRRTTVAEPRLSELVDEYLRIGYDVEVVPYEVEPGGCGVCFDASAAVGETYGDIFVRPGAPASPEGEEHTGRAPPL